VLFEDAMPTPAAEAAAQAGRGEPVRRKALCIGISSYPGADALTNPVNDATSMHTTLEGLGYLSTLQKDCDVDTMHTAIDSFIISLNQGDTAIFYFAGHGCEYRNSNYLICTDTFSKGSSDSWLARKAVKLLDVLNLMQEKSLALSVLLLDCCRAFRGMTRSAGSSRAGGNETRGLCKLDVEQSHDDAFIGLACAPNSVAMDNPDGENGLFTKHLLQHIGTPGLDIDLMFKKVAGGVYRESGNVQRPWKESNVINESATIC